MKCFSFQGSVPKHWCLHIWTTNMVWGSMTYFISCVPTPPTHTHMDGSYGDEIPTLIRHFSFMTLVMHSIYTCLMQVPPESCKSKPRWLTFSCSPSSQDGTERSLPSSCLLVLSLLLWGGGGRGLCCSYSGTRSCPTLYSPVDCSTPGSSRSPSLSLEVSSNSRPSSQWCHPTISSCHPLLLLPSIFPSIRVFSNESAVCIKWPKYWSFVDTHKDKFGSMV